MVSAIIFFMEIFIGGRNTRIEVVRKKIKNMYLRIKPDGSLLVTCSRYMTQKDILRFVASREEWIIKAQIRMQKHETVNREGINGPVIYWLGEKKYAVYKQAKSDRCTVDGDIITFYLREESDESIKKAFRKAANEKLMSLISEKREEWDRKICDANHLRYPRINMRYMTSRWGVNHISKNYITMSTRLIHYPEEALDYVLLHEYVHFLVPDHSSLFYSTVRGFMPEYKTYEKLLKQEVL